MVNASIVSSTRASIGQVASPVDEISDGAQGLPAFFELVALIRMHHSSVPLLGYINCRTSPSDCLEASTIMFCQ